MYEREADFGYPQLHQLSVNRLQSSQAAAAAAAAAAATRQQQQPNNMVIAQQQPPDYPHQHANISFPITPDVKLKKLAFYDTLATLMKPTTLIPANNQRIQEKTFNFHLNLEQATNIAMHRDIRNPQKVEHIIQVQLRFCVLDITAEQEDCFPPNVIVKLNNKQCPLPNPIPTNKPGLEPKRPPRPVNITQNVKLSPTVTNHLQINWCMEFNKTFVVAVYLVRKLTSSQLLQRLAERAKSDPHTAEQTRELIIKKMRGDDDVAPTMLKVSLMCPLGKMRMTTPCRARTCNHFQCFDASLYLQMNERKPTWVCPVCDKPAVFDNLVIDGYFQDVLASNILASDINEIQLHDDGSWSPCEKLEETKNEKKTSNVTSYDDDIAIIDDDDDDDPPKPHQTQKNSQLHAAISDKINAAHSPVEKTHSAQPPSRADTVDLTLSDSDDEPPPPRASSISRPQSSMPSNGTPNSRPTSATSGGGGKPNELSPYPTPSSSTIVLDSPSPPHAPIPIPAGSYLSPSVQAQLNALYQNSPAIFHEAVRNPEELARQQYLEQLALYGYDFYQQYLDRRDMQ